ncbi:SH3 domain-containing protein [Leptospira biflexa]|uniref:HEAT repeat domain-containing protein n=1 Tax=Leptospira biflexa TaxID=172 RepID=UPI001091619B|nr:HEAT repeat domain-containing protein [Leptospira biflexa]TGM47336.1 SH3 domain-containing protein [Leptospira biflexa]TGM50198.1 SH3 domain-containing protein [Leptospira biflexa]
MKKLLTILIFALSFQLYAGDLKDDLKSATGDSEKISILAEMGKSGETKYVKPVTEQLEKGESSKIRAQAATSLGDLKAGFNELHKAFDNDDVYVREASIEALAKIGNSKSQSYFEKGTKDKNEKIRFYSVQGLSKVGRSGNAPIFRNAIEWKDKPTQLAAIRGLGNINAWDEWKYVKPFCSNSDKDFVMACLYSAGKFKTDESLLAIESLLASPDTEISKEAFHAIANFKPAQVIPTLIRFKKANPNHPNLADLSANLKKLKAAKQYAIINVSDRLNLRSKANERSEVITGLPGNAVVEIISREPRKYIITNSKGEEMEDFWYQIKTSDGKKGYLFGEYIHVVDSY